MVGASRSTAGATLHPTEARRIGNQQQRDVIALVNPVAPTRDLVWAPDTGATMRQVTPAPGTQTNAALADHLYEQGRVMRVAPPQEPSVFSSLMSALALSSGVPAIDMYAPYQPKPVPPAMMMQLTPIDRRDMPTFPVYVGWSGFGAALVLSSVLVQADDAVAPALWFVVHKLLPLGYLPGEPFAQGSYAVHAGITRRLTMAVAGLFPQQNLVLVDDYRGDQWTTEYVLFRQPDDPRWEVMRRLLMAQHPELFADTFGTRLKLAPPPDLMPGGVVPAAYANAPPVLLAPRPPSAAAAAETQQQQQPAQREYRYRA
jgi:hypothetical protein